MGLFKTINDGMDILVDKAVYGQRKMKSIDGPTFLKDFSKDNKQLKDLEKLYSKLKDGDKKNSIGRDIRALKQGLNGENNVYYELKASGIPMYCLHDIRLECEGLSAQIDFVVITKQCFYIIETKNLYGNIEINAEGEFIRWNKSSNGRKFREGMYSPVEQNNKHIKMIKNILSKEFKIKNMPVKSMVVMANPKAIINKSKCPKELKNVVIRHEQVTKYIEKAINEIQYSISEEKVKEVAEYLVKNHKPITFDNEAKYCLMKDDYCSKCDINNEINIKEVEYKEKQPKDIETCTSNDIEKTSKDAELYEKLHTYRNNKAKEEGYDFRHYHYVFSKSIIEQLVENKPTSTNELFNIKGLGKVKVGKYGDDIVEIIGGGGKG